MTRRADRLFRLVSELRGRRLAVTAQTLADRLEVSKRTIYRDIRDLMASGVPIDGEAGVGYMLAPDYELPPIMFTREETLALLVGGQMVRAFTDPGLARAVDAAETKIRAILDDEALRMVEGQPYRVPVMAEGDALRARHQTIREATEARIMLDLDYLDADGNPTVRRVWPLGLIGWTGRWTLLAWCELRRAYRNFRFDRIAELTPTGEHFPDRPDRSLTHFIKTTWIDH